MNRIPIVGKFIDERFLTHRLRSSSTAGIVAGIFSLCLFMWRLYVNHTWSWDLLSVAIVFVIVKWAVMIRLRMTQ